MISVNSVLACVSVGILCVSFVCGGDRFSSKSCQKIDACSCAFDNGDTIDLHFAANLDNGNPIFYHHLDQAHIVKYSPCVGFSCGAKTKDSSLCIDDSFLRPSVDLGTISSSAFHVVGQDISLIYASNDTGKSLVSRVKLKCSGAEQFVLDTNTSTTYNFTLFTRCACPGVCRAAEPNGGMSVGTILLLIFFSVLIVYFGMGCVYRKLVYGGSCVEIVPHREFWFSLPSLIKDGYMFFISPCLGNRTEYRTYDKL